MADQQLKVIITADASGVGPGIAEATAAVQASADQIATAQAKATAATKALAAAQIQLGAAAEAGSGAAAAIIAEYAEASAAATAAVEAMTAAQVQNTAATVADTAAQAADTKVTYNRMEAMGSARVAMGAMSGSMGMMEGGLARLAAGSQTLGPLMQSMIPLAIMAAGVYMLYDLGEALYKAFDMGGDAARAAQKDIINLNESYDTLIDETTLEGDKLGASLAKLEHQPNPNAIKEAIDEALVDTDKLQGKLDSLIDREQKLLDSQGMNDSAFRRFFLNEPGSRQEDIDLAQHERHLADATTKQDKLAESIRFTATEQEKLNHLLKEQHEIDIAQKIVGTVSPTLLTQLGVSDFNKEIERLQLIVAEQKKESREIQGQIEDRKEAADVAYVTATKQIEEDEKAGIISHAIAQQRIFDAGEVRAASLKKEGDSDFGTPSLPPITERHERGSKVATDNLPEQIAQKQIELTHAKDGELSADQKIVEEMNKQIALNDLKAKTSKEGTAAERETLRVIEDQIAVDKAFTALDKLAADEKKKADEAAKKSQADALRQQDEDLKTVDDQLVKQHKAQVDAARDKAELAIQSAALDFELSQEEIRAAEQSGRMSHKVAEQKLQDALRLKEQQTSVARQEEMGVLKPGAFEEDTRSYKKMQDQMVLDAKRGALERERITDQETNKMEQAYKKAANEFNRDFEKAFNEWATKSKTAGQAFGRMLGEMELQVIDFAAKWLLEQAEMWAMHKVMQSLALGQEAAKNTTANTQAIISDAAKGAAGAEAAAAPAGPEAMAAAGAVATVMIMSNLSTVTMDTGGMMPHMGFAFNASGSPERVLSPSQTHNFESLVNNGGSRSAVLHQTNNYGGAPTKEMHEAQTAHTINRLKSMLRPEAFA